MQTEAKRSLFHNPNKSITSQQATLPHNPHNVQRLPVSSTYNTIQTWLNRFPSENTKKNYTNSITEYFFYKCGKELNQLHKDDIEYITVDGEKQKLMLSYADEYKQHLKKKYSNNTVKNKLSAIRSLFEYLSQNDFDVKYNIFDLKFLEAHPESYDNIPFYLIDDFAKYALEEEYAGVELCNFILLSAQTSTRVEATLRIKKKDIKFDPRLDLYLADVIDKGDKKRTVPIDKEIYEKIKEMTEGYKKDDHIFKTIKQDWINNKIKKIAKNFKELDEKRIVCHSLRHSAAVFEMETTGNIDRVMQQTGHSSVEVCVKTYASSVINYNDRAGIRMRKKVDEEILDKISKEDILRILKSNNKSAYHQLLLDLNKELNG